MILPAEVVMLSRFELETTGSRSVNGYEEIRETVMHLRKGDTVEVTAGDDSGKRGSIVTIDRKNRKVTIQGVNNVYKHVRRGHPKSPQGGRLKVEMPVDMSNVMLICPETNKPTRVGVKINDDGSKDLIAKTSGARMRQISPAKKK